MPQFGFEQVRTAFILLNLIKKTSHKTMNHVHLNLRAPLSIRMSWIPLLSRLGLLVLNHWRDYSCPYAFETDNTCESGLVVGYCYSNIITIGRHYLLFSCLNYAHSHHHHSSMKILDSFLMIRRPFFNSNRIDHSVSCVWCGCVLALWEKPR